MSEYRIGCRKLVALAFALSLSLPAGCYRSYQPNYKVIPPVSKKELRVPKVEECETEGRPWACYFSDALKELDAWAPPGQWFKDCDALKKQIKEIALEYAIDVDENYCKEVFEKLPKAMHYFRKDKSSYGEGKDILERNVKGMLERIVSEHQPLLAPRQLPLPDESGLLPRMVSQEDPVGVSLAVIYPKEEPKAKEAPPAQVIINGLSKDGVTGANRPATPPYLQVMVNGLGAGGANEKPDETPLPQVPDFKPVQDITLTLSTVLNSAEILDRLEYVTTFIYIYPYPKPPNGWLNLDNEFWRCFFSYQAGRIKGRKRGEIDGPARDSIGMDLKRSLRMMQTYVRDTETTVIPKDTDLGQITQNTKDSLGGGITGTVPGNIATITPTVNFSSEKDSSTVTKLIRQIDQRSVYIAAGSNFLRITQRGMANINLGGRFNEHIQLYVPPASETIKVVMPVPAKKTGEKGDSAKAPETAKGQENKAESAKIGLSVRSLAQPLYPRVDALIASVAVVRRPTRLRPTKHENFGLPQLDAADTEFIVELPRPGWVNLWEWQRTLDCVFATELAPGFPMEKNERIYFDSQSTAIYDAAPLVLAGFSDELASALRAGIHQAIFAKAKQSAEAGHEGRSTPKSSAGQENRPSITLDDGPLNVDVFREPDPHKKGSYYICLEDKSTHAKIRLGLLDDSPQGRPKLRPFDPQFFREAEN